MQLMKRNMTILASVLVLFAMACGSMNRMTPKQWDDKVIEADVRGKILEAVPSKTFAVDVKVNHQVVTLSGHAASEEDRRKIGAAAQSVNGVTTVINNITVQP
jgi:osmotically-inducible protein OsmY